MHIVIATPLYPPDIALPAPYVKELARRLAGSHQVTIVTYGKLPEKVPGVRIIAVPKNRMLPMRLVYYTFILWKAARSADVIYAQNGASVELPAGLVGFFANRPLVVGLSDASAHDRAAHKKRLGMVERFALGRATTTVMDMPLARPEILPFEPRPEAALDMYEKSWNVHLKELENIFAAAKNHD